MIAPDTRRATDFLEVLRHELACVADRRRCQRIEALQKLGADGDYSRKAVQWAEDAAKEEARLAAAAAKQADQALALTIVVDEARKAVLRLTESPQSQQVDAFGTAVKDSIEAAKTSLRQSQNAIASAANATSSGHRDASAARLRKHSIDAIKKLDEVISRAGQAVDERERLARAKELCLMLGSAASDFLSRSSIFRQSRTSESRQDPRASISQKKEASEQAKLTAQGDRDRVIKRGSEIRSFAFSIGCANTADKLSAFAALRDKADPDKRALFIAEMVKAAAETATMAAHGTAEAMSSSSPAARSVDSESMNALRASITALSRSVQELPEHPTTDESLISGVIATGVEIAAVIAQGFSRALENGAVSTDGSFSASAGLLDALHSLCRTALDLLRRDAIDNRVNPSAPWPDLPKCKEDLLHAERSIRKELRDAARSEVASPLHKAILTFTTLFADLPTDAQTPLSVPPPDADAAPAPQQAISFESANQACAKFARASLVYILHGLREPQDFAQKEQDLPSTEWDAELGKKVATQAVRELGEDAIDVARNAWAAETAAAEAIRCAIRFVDDTETCRPASASVPPAHIQNSSRGLDEDLQQPPPEGPDVEQVRLRALDMELVGLAFSGGGIRSATFGLGILQALGQLRLLRVFDYFSTVSGGGYIGSWLAAWIHREQSLMNVEKQLEPGRVAQSRANRTIRLAEDDPGSSNDPPELWRSAIDEEPEPINHLRAYSRYLSPRTGIFSADTWTLGSIYFRNLLINLLTLLPFALGVLLLSRVLVWVFTLNRESLTGSVRAIIAIAALFSAAFLAIWLYHQRSRLQEAADSPVAHPDGADRLTAGLFTAVQISLGLIACFSVVLCVVHWGVVSGIVCGIIFLFLIVQAIRVRSSRLLELRNRFQLRTELVGGILLFLTLFTIASALWLFSYSPPGEPTVQRLSEAEAVRQALPLRHPGYYWLNYESRMANWDPALKFVTLFGLGMALLSSMAAFFRARRPALDGDRNQQLWKSFFCDVVLGVATGACLYLALWLVVWKLGTDAAATVTLGVPILLVALVLASYAEMLLLGRLMNESEREWRSRLGAVLFMSATGWLLFFGSTLYLPWLLLQVPFQPIYRNSFLAALTAVWGVLSTLSAWAGRWLQEGGTSRRSGLWLSLLVLVGPAIFLIGLFALLSGLTFVLPPVFADDWLDVACDPSWCAGMKWFGYFLLSAALAFLFSFSVDVNLFSLHLLYANRLIRGYLGASRRKQSWRRRANGPFRLADDRWYWVWGPGTGGAPTNAKTDVIARREPSFTGFDPADDFPLSELKAVGPSTHDTTFKLEPDEGYRGPYPLFNTALNLVADKELAVQDRKAASFILTPDFCGAKATGYARIPPGSDGDYLTLGRAMTISGAAVDPNMNIIQSPPLTALMTILNTRLGWWIQNPAVWLNDWNGSGPGAGMLLLRELFGQTDQTSDYIHLSDGGHFENLGVYELVRRRCRFIVVTDATEDRHAASVNLGNLIRLVRTDFGISIDVGTDPLTENKEGVARWHCALGVIHYEDVDPQAISGVLVYLRAVLTGDEPPDVRQYADTCPDFPHQTTFDQFFTEAQFESYRALGYHVAMQVFGEAASTMNQDACDPIAIRSEIRQLFANLRRRWFPAPPRADQEFLPMARMSIEAKDRLGQDLFQRLRRELYPELLNSGSAPPIQPSGTKYDESSEMTMVSRMLQCMEMVWFAMNLDAYYAHPINRGWMNLFRRWTGSPTFQKYWHFLRAEFSRDFVSFCERALNLIPVSVTVDWLRDDRSVANWLEHIQRMDKEFLQEWASETGRLRWLTTGRYISDSVAYATAFANKIDLKRPPVWLLSLRNGQPGAAEQPCGLVCATPPFRGAGKRLEFLVWLQGPYRSLGVGGQCLNQIIDDLSAELREKNLGEYQLFAYYPDTETGRAARLQKTLWKNFFFDYQFRSVSPTDPGAIPGVITLGRELTY
jgi:hypothetical protein